jgi:tetratricopeptide (TPR) repeat protein
LWVTLAASVLLAVGLLVSRPSTDPQVAEARTYNSAKKLLENGQFDEARQLLSSSANKKIASARLSSLRSQAVREMPSLFALASAGRLTDFGFNPIAGPIFKDFMTDPAELARQFAAMPVGKGAQAARDLLAESKSDEVEVLLNRGHALLSLGDLASAAAEFQRATEAAPQQSLSWLGLGLARFMQSRYADAEAAFREALKLAPESFSAAMNLAMALDEQGKAEEALTVWKQQLDWPLAAADRQLVEQAIHRLQKP